MAIKSRYSARLKKMLYAKSKHKNMQNIISISKLENISRFSFEIKLIFIYLSIFRDKKVNLRNFVGFA